MQYIPTKRERLCGHLHSPAATDSRSKLLRRIEPVYGWLQASDMRQEAQAIGQYIQAQQRRDEGEYLSAAHSHVQHTELQSDMASPAIILFCYNRSACCQ